MPSIEIICIGQDQPRAFSDLPFAVLAERELVSHRSPAPLWQSDFDRVTGCIYHLGNPSLRGAEPDRVFFAYDLLSELSKTPQAPFQLEFAVEYQESVHLVLAELLSDSPHGKALFTSDWQFGPPPYRHPSPLSLNEFWGLHSVGQLRLNALYALQNAA
jgi:hypothetical protein